MTVILLTTLSLCTGVHRSEKGHQEDVCHEIHEQEHVHQEGCHTQCLQRSGTAATTGSSVPRQPVVYLSGEHEMNRS